MSDKRNGREGQAPQTPPPRTTTDDFKLDLTDEAISTGALESVRGQKDAQVRPMPSRRAFQTEKERKKADREHRKRNKIKAGKNKRVFTLVWIVMVVLVALSLASYLILGTNDLFAIDREQELVEVTIPENYTFEQLADIIQEAGVINQKDFFLLYLKVTASGKKEYILPGARILDRGKDYEGIVNDLMPGEDDAEVVTVVFPEGTNALGVAEILEENGLGTKSEILDAMQMDDLDSRKLISSLTNVDQRYYKLEGYLYPDTYQFYTTDDYVTIFAKMLDNSNDKLKAIKDSTDKSSLSVDQILTLASIIQREAANRTDMYKISRILHNRLERSDEFGTNRLECDSTTFYPYRTRDEWIAAGGEDGRYDTYRVEGLPAGPICNPGMDAISAALTPSDESDVANAFYFCHDADGNPYYADDEYEHYLNQIEAGLNPDGYEDGSGE